MATRTPDIQHLNELVLLNAFAEQRGLEPKVQTEFLKNASKVSSARRQQAIEAQQQAQQQGQQALAAAIGQQGRVRSGTQATQGIQPTTLDQALTGASGGAAAQQQLAQLRGGQGIGQLPAALAGGTAGLSPLLVEGQTREQVTPVEGVRGLTSFLPLRTSEVNVKPNQLTAQDVLKAQVTLAKAKAESFESYLDRLAEAAVNPRATPGEQATLLKELQTLDPTTLRDFDTRVLALSSEISQQRVIDEFKEPLEEVFDEGSSTGSRFLARREAERREGLKLLTAERHGIGAAQLTKGAQTQIQNSLIALTDTMDSIGSITRQYQEHFLTLPARLLAFAGEKAERLNIDLSDSERKQLFEMRAFDAEVASLLNARIRAVSGAAVSAQEAERLRKEIPTLRDGKTNFLAKLAVLNRITQAGIIRRVIFLEQGLGFQSIEDALRQRPDLRFDTNDLSDPGFQRVMFEVEKREVRTASRLRQEARDRNPGAPIDERRIQSEAADIVAQQFGISRFRGGGI